MLPKDGLYKYLYQPGEQHEDKKDQLLTLSAVKIPYRLDQVVKQSGNLVFHYLQDGPHRAFVREELMCISGDSQVPLE